VHEAKQGNNFIATFNPHDFMMLFGLSTEVQLPCTALLSTETRTTSLFSTSLHYLVPQ